MDILEIINKFDSFLQTKKLRFEAVAIGGAALNLLGIVSRYTRDCDILDPIIPEDILEASKEFAKYMRNLNIVLADDWLNNGPRDLITTLPLGWETRLSDLFNANNIVLKTLERSDLLKTKLFAFCDRGTDKKDCLLMKPTRVEILDSLDWIKDQDANQDWPDYVSRCLNEISQELGHVL